MEIKGVYSHSGHIVGQDCAHLLSTECVLAGLGRRREEINKYVVVRRDTPRLPVSERVRTCVAAAQFLRFRGTLLGSLGFLEY